MEITFETKELRDLCIDEEAAAQKMDRATVEVLKRRLSDIHAADSIGEVLVGNPRPDTHGGVECYVIDLPQSFRLTVVPAHREARMNSDGSADWSRIRRVKVVSLQP